MTWLVLGLIIFLGSHSVRIFANEWRQQTIARIGANAWKGAYSVISIVGFVLIVIGFGVASQGSSWLWYPPVWTRHLAALLILFAFIFLAAAKLPMSKLKSKVGHPMVIGVKIWAFAHLLSNGTVADFVLFGSFLVWSIVLYARSRRLDRANGVVYSGGAIKNDLLAIVIGLLAYGLFAAVLHKWLIGISPFIAS